MKAFMEEYGVIIVAVIIIMLLVLVANTGIGPAIRDGIVGAVTKLTDALKGALGTV